MKSKIIVAVAAVLSVGTWAYANEQGMSSQGGVGQKQDQSSSSTSQRSGMSAPKDSDAKIAGEQSGFPNPAFPKVEGKLLKIEGDSYTIQDKDGVQTRLLVDDKTQKEVNLKLGDEVTAERTLNGYAKWIRARK